MSPAKEILASPLLGLGLAAAGIVLLVVALLIALS
jgi:hypothetical protein